MKLSFNGILLAARPPLGRAKRRALRTANRLKISGKPAPTAEVPERTLLAHQKFLWGTALLKSGKPEDAARVLAESIELDGRYGRRAIQLARALRLSARYEDAANAYASVLQLQPNNLEAMLWVSLLALREPLGLSVERDPDEIIAEFVENGDAEDALSTFLRGCVFESTGDVDTARELFTSSLTAEPDHPARHLHVARFEAAQGHWDDASRAFRMVTGGGDQGDESPASEQELRRELDAPAPNSSWPGVAALAQERLRRDDTDQSAVRTLGLALFALRDWAEASVTLERAVRADPTDVALVERWAVAAERAEQFESRVEARQQAVLLSPTASRFHRLALALSQSGRDAEAVIAFEHAVRLGGARVDWFDRFGVIQRRKEDWASAVLVYTSATKRFPDRAHFQYFLGFALEKGGEFEAARRAYDAAVTLEPDRADWWFRLGYLHERFGPERVVMRPRTGLEFAAAGDLAAAASAYRSAVELDPTVKQYWRRLGGVEEARGELDAAREAYEKATELDPDDHWSWHLVGRTVSAAATRRGMYHSEEHDELERLWGRAIELGPHAGGSRDQLVRASIKAARWPLANELAWYPQPAVSDGSSEDALRSYLAGEQGSSEAVEVLQRSDDALAFVPKEWWFPLHWKLLTDNLFTAGYRAKELLARRIVADGVGRPEDNLPGYLEHARALTFLDEHEAAAELLQPSLTARHTARVRNTLNRQAADASLLLGDLRPHVEAAGAVSDHDVGVAEQSFREMINGRSVAIVGPGLSDEQSGQEIDDHDVVIRTKFTKEQLSEYTTMAGSRTDISYYALGSARFLQNEISDAISSGDLQMAVFRTATYTPDPPYLVRPGDIRYVPSEYTAGLRASQFAIQRIFYDIIRYGPSSVKVFNIDFFLSPDAYRPGYLAEYANQAVREGYLKVLGSFGHDFLADFKFTQAMFTQGRLDGDERIRQIMALTPAQYLAGLDRRS